MFEKNNSKVNCSITVESYKKHHDSDIPVSF